MGSKLYKKQENYFIQQYKLILSHTGVGVNDEGAIKYLIRITITCSVLLLFIILLFVFKNSKFVCFFTQGNEQLFLFTVISFIYLFIWGISFTSYNVVSYYYEKRNKHELLKKDIKGLFNLLYNFYLLINLPWITLTYIIVLIFKCLKIENLGQYIGLVILIYSYCLIVCFLILIFLCNLFNSLLVNNVIMLNSYFNENTILYFLVFFSILVSKKLQEAALNLFLKKFVKNRYEYEKILKQNKLLLYYILIVITFFLKALNLTGTNKEIIDALFYSTNMLTMISTATQKANA